MIQMKGRVGLAVFVAVLTFTTLGISQSAHGAEFDVRELVPITETFSRLAMWDVLAAGELWMDEATLETWERFVDTALPNQTATIAFFSDCLVLADIAPNGAPMAGLFNPWTGTLVVFAFSEDATVIEAVIIELVASQVEEESANEVALALMDAIRLAGDRLDTVGLQPASEDDWMVVADRVISRSAKLRLIYPAETPTAPSLGVLQETMLQIQAGELSGLLSVLEDADPEWVQSLLPLTVIQGRDSTSAVLGSRVEPLAFAWISIEGDVLQEVSWIRLYDRVITQTREAS